MLRVLSVLASLFGQPGGTLHLPPCEVRLGLASTAGYLTLTGTCRSLLDQPARYRYALHVRRAGSGGHSQNTQAGEFALPARQQAVLSTFRLNVEPQDSYQAKLMVFDFGGRIIAQDSVGQ